MCIHVYTCAKHTCVICLYTYVQTACQGNACQPTSESQKPKPAPHISALAFVQSCKTVHELSSSRNRRGSTWWESKGRHLVWPETAEAASCIRPERQHSAQFYPLNGGRDNASNCATSEVAALVDFSDIALSSHRAWAKNVLGITAGFGPANAPRA